LLQTLRRQLHFISIKLGFEVRHIGPPDDPFWAIVGRDDISIMLKCLADVKPAPNHTLHEWALWNAYIYMERPDQLFDEYTAAGITLRRPIQIDGDNLRGLKLPMLMAMFCFSGGRGCDIRFANCHQCRS
jgi:hypothetical protein